MKKQELVEAIAKVNPAVKDGKLIEFKGLLLFDNDKLTSYGDEISVSVPLKTDFQCAVRAEEFSKFISKTSGEDIELSLDDNQIFVKSKNTEAGFSTVEYNPESVPDFKINEIKKWNKLPDDFLHCLKFCTFSASSDNAYGVLCNLKVEKDRVMSSDNYRITEKSISKKIAGIKDNLLISKKIALFLCGFDLKHFFLTDTCVHYKDDTGTVFTHRLIVDEYPDIDEFLAIEGNPIVFPKNLVSALERAGSIFNKDDESKVNIKISSKTIGIRGEKVGSWVEEPVESDYEGEDISFMASPEHLIEILKYSYNAVIGENAILFTGEGYKHSVCLMVED